MSGLITPLALDELRALVERLHSREPQRAMLAKVYLDSLAWGAKGLSDLGQTLGFTLVGPWPPLEFPKMLYRGHQTAIAHNAIQQQNLEAEGFRAREPEAVPISTQDAAIQIPTAPPTIQVPLPRDESL